MVSGFDLGAMMDSQIVAACHPVLAFVVDDLGNDFVGESFVVVAAAAEADSFDGDSLVVVDVVADQMAERAENCSADAFVAPFAVKS